MSDKARESGYRIFSLGIVVTDKDENSDNLSVTPIEHFSFADGPLATTKSKHSVNIPNAFSKVKNVSTSSSNVITATWRALSEGNRVSAPNVRASETVLLWTFANTSEYFWCTLGREPSLRKLEKVVYLYGGTSSQSATLDNTNSYWVLIDTINKLVQLHTSNTNGEAVSYDIILDTNAGTLTIQDSVNNNILLDSNQGNLTATINNKIVLNAVDVEINASNSYTVNTANYVANVSGDTTFNTSQATFSGNITAAGKVSGTCFNGPLC